VRGNSGEAGSGASAAAAETTDASGTGPFRSPLSASNCGGVLLPAYRSFRFVSPQLCGLVSTRRFAVWPFAPPSIGVADRAI